MTLTYRATATPSPTSTPHQSNNSNDHDDDDYDKRYKNTLPLHRIHRAYSTRNGPVQWLLAEPAVRPFAFR